jgi:putative membrane protein
LPGVHVDSLKVALFVALVLSFLNVFLKPLLILFTIPLTLVTLGLFLMVINGIIILVADNLIDGFEVSGFFWALVFSFLLSLSGSLFDRMEQKEQ